LNLTDRSDQLPRFLGPRGLRNSITGIAACCARAVSGHATTLLLKGLMNSRRLMGFTPLAENHLRKNLMRFSSDGYAPYRSKSSLRMSARVKGGIRPR